MRTALVSMLILVSFVAAAANDPDRSLPADAAKRVIDYESEKAAIQNAADADIKAARDRLIQDLEVVQEAYTKTGKLDEALTIRERIRDLKGVSEKPGNGGNSLQISDWELYFFDGRWQKTPLERIKSAERGGTLSLTYETGPHVIAWVGYRAKPLEADFTARMELRGAHEIGIRPTSGSDATAFYDCGSADGWLVVQFARRKGELSMRINGKPVEMSYNLDAKPTMSGLLALTFFKGKTVEVRSFKLDVGP